MIISPSFQKPCCSGPLAGDGFLGAYTVAVEYDNMACHKPKYEKTP